MTGGKREAASGERRESIHGIWLLSVKYKRCKQSQHENIFFYLYIFPTQPKGIKQTHCWFFWMFVFTECTGGHLYLIMSGQPWEEIIVPGSFVQSTKVFLLWSGGLELCPRSQHYTSSKKKEKVMWYVSHEGCACDLVAIWLSTCSSHLQLDSSSDRVKRQKTANLAHLLQEPECPGYFKWCHFSAICWDIQNTVRLTSSSVFQLIPQTPTSTLDEWLFSFQKELPISQVA